MIHRPNGSPIRRARGAPHHFNPSAIAAKQLYFAGMVRTGRFLIILLALILSATRVFAANPDEDRAFAVALEKFHSLPASFAEKDFAAFIQKYPNSVRVPEAILYQAEARIYSGQATGAIELLTTNQARADKLAPQYLYWLGRAHFQNADYSNAASVFAQFVEKYTNSLQVLDASVREAESYGRLRQWPRVLQILRQTNGFFQVSVRGGAKSETIASGFILLGEAQLAHGDLDGVSETLKALEKLTLSTDLKWQQEYLACRRERAAGDLDEALLNSADLLVSGNVTNRAAGVDFQAGVLEQIGNLDAAIDAYTNNLLPEVPTGQQRRAILKISELDLKQNKLPDAVQRLSNFLSAFPGSKTADLAVLTLGEVRLKQALAGSDTNLTGGETNLFARALEQFNLLTNTEFAGKAYLDRGWCLWCEGTNADHATNITEFQANSQTAFSNAVSRLPFSWEQAEARFKWADTQLQLKQFAAAVTNYNYIAENYASLPEAKQNDLIERALYQSMRAALDETNLVAASSALKNILAWFPNGFAGPSSLLLTGQGLADQKDPAAARNLFAEFEERYPTNQLLSDIRLAIARSYEQERNWDAAISNYIAWTSAFPNDHLIPQAKFSLAWDNYMAGNETNALILFTNFIAQFPTNELSARAQYWLGDSYFRQGDYLNAEHNYQLVFQNYTNLSSANLARLTAEARMMAGRAAMNRFAYKQAIDYFTNLFLTPDYPRDLQVQATVAYADATVSRLDDVTNKTADLIEAIKSLKTITNSQPNTWEAAQALGRMGDCYFEWGARDPDQYTNAASAYHAVFDSAAALADARNEARFKLGAVYEKQAGRASGTNQTVLLNQALNQYANAFYEGLYDPEGPSPFWTEKSGLKAGELAESLQEWQSALNIYTDLKHLLPAIELSCDKKIQKAKDNGARP
jgi:TolA-binding protein